MKLEAFLGKRGVKIERKRRADKRIVILRKINVEENAGDKTLNENSSFVEKNRSNQSNSDQNSSLELKEVPMSEISGDYKGDPIETIIVSPDREQGEI
jgi:hypothetical protein